MLIDYGPQLIVLWFQDFHGVLIIWNPLPWRFHRLSIAWSTEFTTGEQYRGVLGLLWPQSSPKPRDVLYSGWITRPKGLLGEYMPRVPDISTIFRWRSNIPLGSLANCTSNTVERRFYQIEASNRTIFVDGHRYSNRFATLLRNDGRETHTGPWNTYWLTRLTSLLRPTGKENEHTAANTRYQLRRRPLQTLTLSSNVTMSRTWRFRYQAPNKSSRSCGTVTSQLSQIVIGLSTCGESRSCSVSALLPPDSKRTANEILGARFHRWHGIPPAVVLIKSVPRLSIRTAVPTAPNQSDEKTTLGTVVIISDSKIFVKLGLSSDGEVGVDCFFFFNHLFIVL